MATKPISLSSIFSPILKLNTAEFQTRPQLSRSRSSARRLLRQISESMGTNELKAALREVAENISQALAL